MQQHEAWRKAAQRHLTEGPAALDAWRCQHRGQGTTLDSVLVTDFGHDKMPASQVQESLNLVRLQVAFDKGSLQEREAAKRELFAQGHPWPRQVGREPNGSPRGAARLTKRRDTVAVGSRSARAAHPGATARQKQRSCLAKQQEKKRRREEADGCLLDSEVTDGLRARVARHQGKGCSQQQQAASNNSVEEET